MRVLRLIAPWRLAGRIFGSYRPKKLLVFDTAPGADLVSPVLEKWFRVRWLFSLGTLILLAPLATADFGGLVQQAINICTTTMLVGAPSVLLIILVLRQIADPAARGEMIRQVRPAILVSAGALLTIFFAIGDYLPFWPDALSLNGISRGTWTNNPSGGAALLSLLLIPVFLWLVAFVLCAAYLVHNNSFKVPGSTIADAVVNIWLAWAVAVANLVLMAIAGISYGVGTVLLAIAGAGIASAISAWELRVLLASGASFRHGPWGVPEARPEQRRFTGTT
jgi:hypothetical protein